MRILTGVLRDQSWLLDHVVASTDTRTNQEAIFARAKHIAAKLEADDPIG